MREYRVFAALPGRRRPRRAPAEAGGGPGAAAAGRAASLSAPARTAWPRCPTPHGTRVRPVRRGDSGAARQSRPTTGHTSSPDGRASWRRAGWTTTRSRTTTRCRSELPLIAETGQRPSVRHRRSEFDRRPDVSDQSRWRHQRRSWAAVIGVTGVVNFCVVCHILGFLSVPVEISIFFAKF